MGPAAGAQASPGCQWRTCSLRVSGQSRGHGTALHAEQQPEPLPPDALPLQPVAISIATVNHVPAFLPAALPCSWIFSRHCIFSQQRLQELLRLLVPGTLRVKGVFRVAVGTWVAASAAPGAAAVTVPATAGAAADVAIGDSWAAHTQEAADWKAPACSRQQAAGRRGRQPAQNTLCTS